MQEEWECTAELLPGWPPPHPFRVCGVLPAWQVSPGPEGFPGTSAQGRLCPSVGTLTAGLRGACLGCLDIWISIQSLLLNPCVAPKLNKDYMSWGGRRLMGSERRG